MLDACTRYGGAICLAAGVTLASALAAPATAQQVIKMTFISGFPPAMTTVGAFVDAYTPAVDAALAKAGRYRIEWNYAHSGQVVKARGEPEGVQSGLGDITHVTTPFHLDRVPLYKVPYVIPFTSKDPALMVKIFDAMQPKFTAFGEAWSALGQVNIGSSGVVDNYIIVSKTPVAKLADLRGKKMGAAGANIPWVQGLGVAGVTSDLAAFYSGLATGVYDSALVWPQAMGAFKLCEPAPHVLDADIGAASIHALNVNEAVWAKLPDEVKTAMREAAAVWTSDSLRRLVEGAQGGYDRCKADFKMVYTRLSDEERVAWAKGLPNIAQEWAKDMDGKGLPGTTILAFYMDELRKANQPIARQWDKE
ncbi:MAG: TRAP transporter substrate-binding protein DctP [Alphaproteobacteria bacterium]